MKFLVVNLVLSMAFPIEEKYILEVQSEMNVVFPLAFKKRMLKLNGGESIIMKQEFELYPFFDKSDNKRIRRTCNHIALETKNARECTGFSKNTIAIGADGSGNQIILLHDGDGILKDEIYFWNHELGDIKMLAKTHILSTENTDNSIWQRIKAILKI